MIPAYLAYSGMVITMLLFFALPPRHARVKTLKQLRKVEGVTAMRTRHARLANRWSVR